jgi:CelD/BcsL family acetyltransferase involved in cellulose biosynthesis
MADFATEDVRDMAALTALEPDWWDLWARSATATPFQSPAWLLAWWRAFAPGELAVIAVRGAGRLVGLAPLYCEAGVRGRRLLPIGISLSDYLDVLVDPEGSPAVREVLAAAIGRSRMSWQTWELTDLPSDAEALQLPCPPSCRDQTEAAESCPVLALPSEPTAWREAVPSRKLRDLRLACHRANRRGGFSWATADAGSAQEMLTRLIAFHGARWRSRDEPGVLADPRVRGFHAAALPRLLRAGIARLYTLFIGGEAVGVYYGFLHRKRAYAYLTGFDPAFGHESPGTILLGHAIEQAAREGACEFHMLRGRERYKYQWGARDRLNQRRIFERTSSYAFAL